MIALADAIDADALRLRHEFLAMPGLVLTVAQTARLFDVSRPHAQRLLDALEAEGFIIGGAVGVYRRSPASPRLN
jgi:DNA-binding GntR family transcriptional regulator